VIFDSEVLTVLAEELVLKENDSLVLPPSEKMSISALPPLRMRYNEGPLPAVALRDLSARRRAESDICVPGLEGNASTAYASLILFFRLPSYGERFNPPTPGNCMQLTPS
jgi:hypothetical protein